MSTIKTVKRFTVDSCEVELSHYECSPLPARVTVRGDIEHFDASTVPEIGAWLGDGAAPLYWSEADGEAPKLRGEGPGGDGFSGGEFAASAMKATTTVRGPMGDRTIEVDLVAGLTDTYGRPVWADPATRTVAVGDELDPAFFAGVAPDGVVYVGQWPNEEAASDEDAAFVRRALGF